MKEMDMAKMLAQAADLSKLFNLGQSGNEKENKEAEGKEQGQEDSFGKMAAMMEIMQFMRSMQQEPEKQKDEKRRADKQEARYYDDPVMTPSIRSIKSAIPYLEHRYQKPLGITVKLIEIQRLLEMYNKKMCFMQDGNRKDWQRGMVEAVRPNMPEAEQYRLEMLLKLMDINELWEKIDLVRKRENKWQSI